MFISEIFHSIQGEGELTGLPSVFIRTSGCNLRCRWCDTPYASWKPKGEEMNLDAIVAEVARYPVRHCVITGGEPMISKELPELLARLSEAGYHLTIETAGTVLPEGITCDLASLSPKLSNSTPLPSEISGSWIEKHEQRRLQPDVLRSWINTYPYQLKFVVTESQDIEEIETLISQIDPDIPPHKILLMPEGRTAEKIRGRNQTLIDLCKNHGYRYCNRLHVELFGDTRGT